MPALGGPPRGLPAEMVKPVAATTATIVANAIEGRFMSIPPLVETQATAAIARLPVVTRQLCPRRHRVKRAGLRRIALFERPPCVAVLLRQAPPQREQPEAHQHSEDESDRTELPFIPCLDANVGLHRVRASQPEPPANVIGGCNRPARDHAD